MPIQKNPSNNGLTLVPSTKAFLAKSKGIHKFLSIPLIPFQLVDNGFIKILEKYTLVDIADKSMIEKKLLSSILSKEELIELIQWLFSPDVADKSYAKRILSNISFTDPISHNNVQFRMIQYYDALNIPTVLSLPGNTLPRDLTAVFSKDQIENQLSLVPLKLIDFIHSYCKGDMSRLLWDPNLNPYFLSFISNNMIQLTVQQLVEMIRMLSDSACIPTTKGMKKPRESFIPSELTSSGLPVVLLNIIQKDADNNEQSNQNLENPVSLEFLKRIGCRMFNIHAFDDRKADPEKFQDLAKLIRLLIKERDNMSKEDLAELKLKKIFRGMFIKQLFIKNSQKKASNN